MATPTSPELLVFIGTYTRGRSEGIYVYRMDTATGALEYVSKATGVDNPSFLALHPSQRYLYCVNETGGPDGKPGGAVSAFALDLGTGTLKYLDQQPSHGTQPCHLVVDATGKYVLVANYGSGSLSMFPIEQSGRLQEASDVVQHRGSSVNPRRQQGPHAHSINLDAANRYAFAADLGMDRVMVYRLDLAQGKLWPNDPPWAQVRPGAGPRHFAFHPGGKSAYLINELDSTMTAFAYDAQRGVLTEVQTLSTLPAGFSETSYCADVHVHPSGRFVYGSNRGHDSIAIFRIDQGSGRLTLVGHESTRGKTPRNFALDPTGTFLLAANQNSDTIVTFRVDQETGKLSATGHVAEVPQPVCLVMVPVAR